MRSRNEERKKEKAQKAQKKEEKIYHGNREFGLKEKGSLGV
jgi:hypothetical protein